MHGQKNIKNGLIELTPTLSNQDGVVLRAVNVVARI